MIDLIEKHRAEIEALCREFGVSRLELFGSAATDEFDPDTSDIASWSTIRLTTNSVPGLVVTLNSRNVWNSSLAVRLTS